MYERGAFTHAETVATAAVLQFYAVGLVGYSVVRIASPAFYAIGRSQVPVVVSALTVVVNALLNVFLADVLSYRGLALGTSLAALVNAGLLLVLLRRHLGGLDGARIGTAAVKIAVAALVMGGAALAIDRAVTGWVASTSLSAQLLRVGTSIGGALAVLAGVAYALRITALTEALDLVRRRVRGRTSV
jgi:putative peptidoglycan lipid II flippase